jgi:5-formyltetrahydrofolate cyclo-ligase
LGEGCGVSDFTSPSGQSKAAARAGFLAARRSRPDHTAADASIRQALLHLATGLRTVAAYLPMRNEPGGAQLPATLVKVCDTLLVPVLLPDRDLDWAGYPDPTPLGVTAITTAELVIVPAVAVDRTGVRLGRGGGSYDRALTRVGFGTPVVAVLYDGELVDELPREPHDRRVTAVITPAGLIRL